MKCIKSLSVLILFLISPILSIGQEVLTFGQPQEKIVQAKENELIALIPDQISFWKMETPKNHKIYTFKIETKPGEFKQVCFLHTSNIKEFELWSFSNGDLYPVGVRWLVRVNGGNGPGPDPTPDPTPDPSPDPKFPETTYNVGPRTAYAFKTNPYTKNNTKQISEIFSLAYETIRSKKSADVRTVMTKLRDDCFKIAKTNGLKSEETWEPWTVLYTLLNTHYVNKVITTSDQWADALNEVVTYLK